MNTPQLWFQTIKLDKSESNLKLYLQLLHEEVVELVDAHNMEELLDAVGDIDFVVQGLQYITDDLNEHDPVVESLLNEYSGTIHTARVILDDFNQHHPVEFLQLRQTITTSNFTKFCTSEEEAKETVNEYITEHNIPTRYELINDYYVIKRISDDKVMKSINFEPPKLEKLAEKLK